MGNQEILSHIGCSLRQPRWRSAFVGFCGGLLVAGCVAESDTRPVVGDAAGRNPNDLFVVDCLLPGQVRKLGSQMTYLTARRPIQTTAQDCEIRGGEYTAYDRANYATALKVWLSAAQQGDPDAQNKVGEIYEKGMGGTPDYEMAALWYKRSAQQGFSRAQINLAFLYERGLGVPADAKKALQLYRDASDLPEAVVIDQSELDESRREMERLRSELNNSRQQLEQARNELQRRERDLRRQQQELRRQRQRFESGGLSPAERARIDKAEQELARQQAELARRQRQIQNLENQSREQRAELLTLRSEGETLREQLNLARQQQGRTRDDLALYQRLVTESAQELAQAKRDLQAAAGTGGDFGRLQALEQELATREQRLQEQQNRTGRLEQEAAQLRQQLQQSNVGRSAEVAAMRAQLEAAQQQLADYRQQLAAGDSALQQARKQFQQSASSGAQVPDSVRIAQLEQQLANQQRLLAQRQAEQQAAVRRLEQESAALEQRLAHAGSANQEEMERLRARLSIADQALGAYRIQLTQSSQALQDTEARLTAQKQARADDTTARRSELEAMLAERGRLLEQQQQAQQAAARRLEQETARWQQQLAQTESRSQSQLAELQKELDAARRQAEEFRTEVASANAQLEQARTGLRTKDQTGAAGTAQVAELEQQLRERQQSLEQYQEMVAQLRSESEDWQAKVKTLEEQVKQAPPTKLVARTGAADVPTAPPTIQLIEPPLMAMRSGGKASISVGKAEKRTIIGQVSAPAGLYAATLNGAKLLVDDKGLFTADVALTTGQTSVSLVAIDAIGKRAEMAFELVTSDGGGGVKAQEVKALKGVNFGKYYALVIGNQDYKYLPKLDTAHYDATSMADVLEKKFGFDTTLVLDADRYQILSALNEMRKKLTERDNLVIYYAGHGELDRVNLRGHWLPVDAEAESTANWISNVAVTDILNVMKTRHVLVIADSCYSGAMTRSALVNIEAGVSEETRLHWMKTMTEMRSRTVLASGGLAPVLDGGGGAHSIFAKSLLSVLQEIDDVTEGQRVYREVAARVSFAATQFQVEQVPEYAPIKFAGHESGDFLFVPRALL